MKPGARRFWTDVAVAEEPDGFGVRLDGKPLMTPAGRRLAAPTRAAAEAVAQEWSAVEGAVRPEAMPYTRAVNVAIDRVAAAREAVAVQIAAYGESDLVCYRASDPEALRRRQAAAWDPVLAWAEDRLGARLVPVEGILHHAQPQASLDALRDAVGTEDAFALTALHELATLSGSLLLALAVRHGALPAEEAWTLARLDETWQAELWGEDAEAAEVAARRREDFLRASRLLELLATR
ncbi:ATP12 family chaperone protein [Amaricoccus sp.]|uniref:ATP12 family chaperone protein n=1 Tax=Amaricoccus sp. TaxID=1872485 RepID=UPI001B57449A|nr:ATP12 family protein [Amaricoccus sp.]MBP7243012.1 ATPase [Amaricoccus sp.]